MGVSPDPPPSTEGLARFASSAVVSGDSFLVVAAAVVAAGFSKKCKSVLCGVLVGGGVATREGAEPFPAVNVETGVAALG